MPEGPKKPITSAEFYADLRGTDRLVVTRTAAEEPDVNKRVGLLPPSALAAGLGVPAFASIAANQHGQHPALATQTAYNAYVLAELLRLTGLASAPVVAPAAPTQGLVDDVANTFSGLLVAGFAALADYEAYGVPAFPGVVSASAAGADIQAGRLTLRNLRGNLAAGTVGFRVAASGNRPAGASLTNATAFTSAGDPVPAPTLSGFTPASAAVGAAVTLTGTNLTGATGVSFNGTQALFTVLNATTINATVPTGATSGLIGVSTPGGAVNSATNFLVTAPDPTLSSTSFSAA